MYWYKLLTSVRNKENFFDTILFKTSAGIFFWTFLSVEERQWRHLHSTKWKLFSKHLRKPFDITRIRHLELRFSRKEYLVSDWLSDNGQFILSTSACVIPFSIAFIGYIPGVSRKVSRKQNWIYGIDNENLFRSYEKKKSAEISCQHEFNNSFFMQKWVKFNSSLFIKQKKN